MTTDVKERLGCLMGGLAIWQILGLIVTLLLLFNTEFRLWVGMPCGGNFYLVCGVFTHIQQSYTKKHPPPSHLLHAAALDISVIAGISVRCLFVFLVWFKVGFWSAAGIFAANFLYMFFIPWALIDRWLPPWKSTLYSFVIWPTLAFLMFYDLYNCERYEREVDQVNIELGVDRIEVAGSEIRIYPKSEYLALDSLVASLNQYLPVLLAHTTRMDSVTFSSDSLVFSMFSTLIIADSLGLDAFATSIEGMLPEDYKTNPSFHLLRENGLPVRMVYLFENGSTWQSFEYPN